MVMSEREARGVLNLSDGESVWIAGIMEHIEAAGIHSGDSTAVIPPVILSEKNRKEIVDIVTKIARGWQCTTHLLLQQDQLKKSWHC